jgi:nucleoside phosphorylase
LIPLLQVCATNLKPCIVIRSLSDLAGGDAEGNQVPVDSFLLCMAGRSGTFLCLASKRSGQLVAVVLAHAHHR